MLLLLVTALAASPLVIDVDPRPVAGLLVVTPVGGPVPAEVSSFVASSVRAVERASGLRLVESAESARDCETAQRFTCWTDRARASLGPRPSFLFVLSIRALSGGQARVRLMAFDLEVDPRARGVTDPAAVEDAVYSASASTDQAEPGLAGSSTAAVAAQLDGQLGARIRPLLERRGLWRPFGGIDLEGAEPGLAIEVDGELVGLTGSGVTALRDVRPGRREIRVGRESPRSVTVARDAIVRLGPDPHRSARSTALLWGGVGSAVAGASLVGVAIARSLEVRTLCLSRSPAVDPSCDGLGGPTSGFDPAAAPTSDRAAINPPGLHLASLGVALLAVGGIWLGSVAAGDAGDDDQAWSLAWFLAGLGAGGLIYAAGAAAGG